MHGIGFTNLLLWLLCDCYRAVKMIASVLFMLLDIITVFSGNSVVNLEVPPVC